MRPALAAAALILLWCGAAHAADKPAPADARWDEAGKAFDEARRLKAAGKHAQAVPLAERALNLREAVLGERHLEVASCLDLLANLHQWLGRYAKAEPLYERALAIREPLLGNRHPAVATSLHNLANVYRNQGLYARAESLYERALAIRQRALGDQHPDVATSLTHLASLYVAQGLYGRAEPLYERALVIRAAAFGENHPRVATSINNLANVYRNRGMYKDSEPLVERALEIREAALGKNHPDVAASLSTLANLLSDQGLYARAQPLHERALAIREAVFGERHPQVATSLRNLANAYTNQGLYGRAEPLYQRALAIHEAALGKHHPKVADLLNNLASLYTRQGLYTRAQPLAERAIAIQEASLGMSHRYVATSLHNLANVYEVQGGYAVAEALYARALSIREEVLGKKHPDVADSLNSLAGLYLRQGFHARAKPLAERALAIQEASLGKGHGAVATSLHNLARIQLVQGRHARAEPIYARALAVREAALGKNHPEVTRSLNSLARLHLAQGRLAEALPLFERAFAASEEHLRQEIFGLSEARLATVLDLLRADEEHLYALVRAHPENARVRRLALSAALLRKGRSVEEISDTSRIVSRSLGQADREAFEHLRALRTQLATLSFDGRGPLAPADYQQRLADLSARSDALEADLARRSAPLRAFTALPSPADMVDRVAAVLPRDGALIELVAYASTRVFTAHAPRRSSRHLRYLALVLFPEGHTRAVDLGPAAPIDAAASHLRDALSNRDAGYRAAAHQLYRLAFRPLLPLLGGVRRLLLAPDGQLSLVPFQALHDGRRFLVDAFDFSYVTSGKELLPRPEDVPPARAMVVLADPDFGTPPAHLASAGGAPRRTERSSAVERFFLTQRAGAAAPSWVPLPGTRQEAEALQRLFPQARLFLGPDASKERLLGLETPGILHIATHGFFLEDASPFPGTRTVAPSGPLAGDKLARRSPDPLLRSGLVLAGALAPAANASEAPTRRLEDSLVTALELAGLDLWGTELVVLSACDTGRGDVKLGQGVYGLRRALVVAGAETLVMSLWKVNDETTRTLMESYYRNLLAGQGRATALRDAMLALRQTRPHPHFWAPFITLGRDGPLQGFAPLALAARTSRRGETVSGGFRPMSPESARLRRLRHEPAAR